MTQHNAIASETKEQLEENIFKGIEDYKQEVDSFKKENIVVILNLRLQHLLYTYWKNGFGVKNERKEKQ